MKVYSNNKCYKNIKELNNENKIGISAEALECKLCYDLFDKIPGLLRCGHSFCYRCIQLLRGQAVSKKSCNLQCPLCTKTLRLADPIVPNYAFDEVLQYASAAPLFNSHFQKTTDVKLLKRLETQKQLYTNACKTLETLEKEKLPKQNEIQHLLDKMETMKNILFCALLVIFCLAMALGISKNS